MEIQGARVLITGATGGLGIAMAERLHAAGARLALSGRRAEAVAAIAEPLGAEVVVADMARREDVDRLAAQVGEYDVLVVNAAVNGQGGVRELSPESIDDAIDVNLRGPIVLSSAFAQARLAAGGPSSLVLIGSLAGMAATANTGMYNATKFGLRGFALSIRQDLDGTNVAVSLIAPGMIRDAGMFAKSGISLPRGIRTKSPEDVASAVERAIRQGTGEVYVSPVELRASTTFATVAPALAARVTKAAGLAERTATVD